MDPIIGNNSSIRGSESNIDLDEKSGPAKHTNINTTRQSTQLSSENLVALHEGEFFSMDNIREQPKDTHSSSSTDDENSIKEFSPSHREPPRERSMSRDFTSIPNNSTTSFHSNKERAKRLNLASNDTPSDRLTKLLTSSSTPSHHKDSMTEPHRRDRRLSTELSPDLISQIESLAKTLSFHTTRDGVLNFMTTSTPTSSSSNDSEHDTLSFEESDEDFNAKMIISEFVRNANEQGIHLRKAGVILEDVGAKGIDSSAANATTVMDIILLPYTIFNFVKNLRNRRMMHILRNVYAFAEPGEMVLVLGRPGAGCSTFLKVTAGQIDQLAGGVTGDISYDGIDQKEMMKHFRSDVIYNGELDVHFPYLTVQQTLDFAIACRTPAVRVNNVSRKEYIAAIRDLYCTIFGLRHTYNTKVGNDFVRGVSGGERKRVSIAEALAARGSIYCWDNATRGLDASTALEYAQAIRVMTNLLGSTAFVTLYQASENIYNTFDKVTVLYLGRQIYYGKIEDAIPYFEKMGYEKPSRQPTAEFLTSMTDLNGLHIIKPGYEDKVPRTAKQFEEYWHNSEEFNQLKHNIEIYKKNIDVEKTRDLYKQSIQQEKSKSSRKQSRYIISYFEQVRLCTIRGFQRIYGNKSFTVTNITAAIIQSLVSGSLFYKAPSGTNGAFTRGGVLYFALLYYSLMGLANMSFEHRPILQKHKMYSLYHPSAEAIASTLSGFPFRMIGLTCFLIILYFLAYLHQTAGSFFIIYLFLVMCSEAINALFECVASACDSLPQANSIAGIIMLAISLYSTYMIQAPKMHQWFKWISYILPIRYAFESMLEAEFHGRHMNCNKSYVPRGPGYEDVSPDNRVCAFTGSKPGQNYVLGDDYLRIQYTYVWAHTWRNLAIMWAFVLGYVGGKIIFTEFKRPVKAGGDMLLYKKGTKLQFNHNDEENDVDSQSKVFPVSSSTAVSTASSQEGAVEPDSFKDLESTGIFIWRKVCYTVPYNGSQRQLLDKVTGYCKPGTLTALMGESGAGKTTLLNTLAQRNVGIITGDMLVNGHPVDITFERRTGYVQQQDMHIAQLSVRESLQFSARVRRPASVSDEEKMHYVERVIEVLDMEQYAEALVGELGRGLNVEQRKKLSIGVELVAKPDLLLFLDEPTSGLDSQSSWAIVQLLRRLANAGQAILCTIHQPSATLFEQFDRLLLLKKGGQTVYFGDIGKNSRTLLDYFEGNGARICDFSENPAEYILESIGAGATASVKEDWHEIWLNSPEYTNLANEVDKLILELQAKEDPSVFSRSKTKYANSYVYQFYHVWLRTTLVFWRSTNYIFSKMMLFTFAGLFIGFSFYNVGYSYAGLQNSLFSAFVSIILSAPLMNQIQANAIQSRELFEVRESKSNMFHWSFILVTQYLSELPYHILFSTFFFVSYYFPLRTFFEASRSAVWFLNYSFVFQLYFVGLGLMVLYMSPNLQSANVIMGLTLSFLIGFCGVVQPKSLMPGFWTFMWKTSPYTYFVQNMVGILLHKKPVRCKKKEFNYFNPPEGQTCGQYMEAFLKTGTGYIDNPDATSDCAYCIYSVGDEYLTYVSASYGNIWRNFGFYWIYIVFNIFAMGTVYYVFHVKNLISISTITMLIAQVKKRIVPKKKDKSDENAD
ncbi:hypothetical protein TBLA_0I01760 [Henningerozyma blattae CBS 6284]|uniref:ABC transporter domain-containing protein n=1 Tax=Henningerozyma blattae (strain ATCC 34711 / CBS 6284 / DSM 70876 / NBRC 10599 / NRRL Y-10934 / UCD 77-7) TaxID=1071380 RepID=I2H8Y2_HENB6|nr:hypothetical protein TBLA_0I01760 [Tetrapisispora blattae CBS 6284]CCH62834.1 hypothetical protein TBLA_0I01760 [Tetrapisispora blattae CBS 6284]